MSNISSVSFRRDPYVLTEEATGSLSLVSRVIVPSVDGFFCCFVERPLLDSDAESAITFLFDTQREWHFIGSVQQITPPNFNYEAPVVWKGYGDFRYSHTITPTVDNSFDIVLVDDEFSGVLNFVTSWFFSFSHNYLTYNTLYRPVLDDGGMIYEAKEKKGVIKGYKMNILVVVMTPALEATYTMLFLNCFPSSLPLSNMQLDVSSHQIRLLTLQMMFDKLIVGPMLLDKVKSSDWYAEFLNVVKLSMHKMKGSKGDGEKKEEFSLSSIISKLGGNVKEKTENVGRFLEGISTSRE